jgi:hypothetical protein
MALLATTARNGSANGAVDVLDAGAGEPTLELLDGATVCRSYTLNATAAFGDASTGVCTANAFTDVDSDGNAGDIDGYALKDGDGNVQISGGVGELSFDTLTVGATGAVEITALTYTQPAGT